jgi:hypothetical protein
MVAGGFVGRAGELARLDGLLGRVGDARRDLPGVAVLLRLGAVAGRVLPVDRPARPRADYARRLAAQIRLAGQVRTRGHKSLRTANDASPHGAPADARVAAEAVAVRSSRWVRSDAMP